VAAEGADGEEVLDLELMDRIHYPAALSSSRRPRRR
jgi:hypothetical protein